MSRIVARRAGWTLIDLHKAVDVWTNLKLVADDRSLPKRNWQLGWNGVRFAQGRDCRLLVQHHPEIHDWLVLVLVGL